MNFRKTVLLTAVAGSLAFSTNAQAEVLTVSGLFPAKDDAANEVRVIAVEPFGGDDGQSLGFAIEKKLENLIIRDEPYFDVISHRAQDDPEALISGSANSNIDTYKTKEKRRRCVQRDSDGDCEEYKEVYVSCLKREINVRASVKMALLESGRNAYLNDFNRSDEQVVCDKDEEFSNSGAEITRLLNSIANSVRYDLAPFERRQQVRVLESRKGMEKGQRKSFKAAVKMTKSDETEACRMWRELSDSGLSQRSLNFNLGLCAEKEGDLTKAVSIYQGAESEFGDKWEFGEGIKRVERRLRAEANWNARKASFAAIESEEPPQEEVEPQGAQ